MKAIINAPRGGTVLNKTIFTTIVLIVFILIPLLIGFTPARAAEIPEVLELTGGEDGSVWERVNQPGFGNDNNSSVVAMAEYQERLYAMTRNEVDRG